jgi:hypothetical protein
MELNEQEKERIIAEEKLRMETRKDFFKENFGRGGWGGHWMHRGGYGYYGCHRFGFLKVLVIAGVIFSVCHFWHRPYCDGGYYGGYQAPAQQAAPPAVKN